MHTEQLKAIFDQFAGREVETVNSANPANGRDSIKLSPNDPAIAELRAAVEAVGCSLRVWLPNGIGTMDYRPNRMNIRLLPDQQGVYRITGFKVG